MQSQEPETQPSPGPGVHAPGQTCTALPSAAFTRRGSGHHGEASGAETWRCPGASFCRDGEQVPPPGSRARAAPAQPPGAAGMMVVERQEGAGGGSFPPPNSSSTPSNLLEPSIQAIPCDITGSAPRPRPPKETASGVGDPRSLLTLVHACTCFRVGLATSRATALMPATVRDGRGVKIR